MKRKQGEVPAKRPPYGFKGVYQHFNYTRTSELKIQCFVYMLTPKSEDVKLNLKDFFNSNLTDFSYFEGFQFIESVVLKPKGKLGEYYKKYDIANNSLETNDKYCDRDIGSMTFKLASNTGTKVSVFLYPNGKMKVSGFGIEVENFDKCIKSIWEAIQNKFFWDFMLYSSDGEVNYNEPEICNINATYSIEPIQGNWNQKCGAIAKSPHINRVMMPTFEIGRSAAIQCYLYPKRKSSAVFDPSGNVHLLGFKTIDELKKAKEIVKSTIETPDTF